ncbi:hypothetical protein TSOC_010668 [Tetrabaena socialis]|uniref:Ankyrin repeat domain-containing protein n=1 Tax=Tetrabaena socialis TaxID=47790 RepID=A0A2J7ZSN3_9CHLO|nr:hypothetical protein TSOC_010668 [Tetrabaena socialis]|eukprot:PNH03279.1 hypothetical protein TSOC_010668 [Tetrabaena socialis]
MFRLLQRCLLRPPNAHKEASGAAAGDSGAPADPQGPAPPGVEQQQEPPAEPGAPQPTPHPQDEGSHTAPDRSHKCWLPELVLRFAGFLTCNEVACILRLINKATAAQFGRPQDRTVRLSLPGHVLEQEVFDAAAAAGQLEVCRLLWQQGCCYGPNLLHHAAAGGHGAVYEWCLETIPGCADHHTAGDAARAGNVTLMDWLLLAEPSPDVPKLLAGAASGCDLLTLQQLHHEYIESGCWGEQLERWYHNRAPVLAAAAGSPTADWRRKVEWLEEWSFPRSAAACVEAARLPDGLARLQWLRPRGYPLSAEVASAAACSGNVEALQFVLAAGVALDDEAAQGVVEGAAVAGHLAVLRALPQTPGVLRSFLAHAAPAAAENGRLPVLEWLVETLGAAQVLQVRDIQSYKSAEVFDAAAAAGQLEVCRLLWQQGCCYGPNLLHHAAAGGHGAVYEWCLETIPGCADHHTAGDAARAGNVTLMDWLLLAEPSPDVPKLLAGAASGCDLLTLQQLHHEYIESGCWGEQLERWYHNRAPVLAAAAGSPTADWRRKVEWLEEWSFPRSAAACVEAARLPDGLARLQWLRPRGYPLSAEVASAAACSGNVEALQFVLAAGVALDDEAAQGVVEGAAVAGHLAVLRALPQTPGVLRSFLAHAAPAAAENGRLPVLEWLVETLGAAQVLQVRDIQSYKSAVRSGSMVLLAWLHAHGCPCDASAFAAAAEWGSEEQLEWLAARGCPMGAEGEAYMRAAAHGDLSMLRCLRRLGCPWGRHTHTFTLAIRTSPLPALWWMLEEGCPVDWDAAVREAQASGRPEGKRAQKHHQQQLQQQEGEGRKRVRTDSGPMFRLLQRLWRPPNAHKEALSAAAGDSGPTAADPHGPAPPGVGQQQGPPGMPELVLRFAGLLTCNEVACILRLVNKATAAQFGRPQDRTVRLSLPVPHHAFVWRWGGARAMHSLTRSRRRQLACLTARSGSIANLELLLARGAKGHVLDQEVFDAAAAAGQLEVCRFLWQQGCCYGPNLLHHAAAGGHGAVYEWCLETIPGCADHHTASDAARAGNVALMDWLLGADPSPDVPKLLAGAASGCDLPTLQRLHHQDIESGCWGEQPEQQFHNRASVLAAAAGSPTADWRLKVEWLEKRGYPRSAAACVEAARLPDGLARLQWLRPRHYPLSAKVVSAAASSGNVETLQFVLAAGVAMNDEVAQGVVEGAAAAGHLAVLRALPQTRGARKSFLAHAAPAAAENGRLPVLEWLVETLGAAQVLQARGLQPYKSAIRSGSMELLAWLHAHGCPLDASAFAAAAEWGSEEQLEWLAARGCPMGAQGEAYTWAVAHGDLSMLRCLRRLGCPWGHHAHTFTLAIRSFGPRPRFGASSTSPLPALWWMLEGCPVDWDAAVREAQASGRPEVLAWMEEERQQREPRG